MVDRDSRTGQIGANRVNARKHYIFAIFTQVLLKHKVSKIYKLYLAERKADYKPVHRTKYSVPQNSLFIRCNVAASIKLI